MTDKSSGSQASVSQDTEAKICQVFLPSYSGESLAVMTNNNY